MGISSLLDNISALGFRIKGFVYFVIGVVLIAAGIVLYFYFGYLALLISLVGVIALLAGMNYFRKARAYSASASAS